MASLADALASSLPIPPVKSSELGPSAPDDSKKPVTPETSATSKLKEDDAKIEDARKVRDIAEGETPAFPTLASPPKAEESNDPIKGYVSAIGILGAVGSMFSRRPMTNSMNAAAGVLDAMKANDDAAFKQKYEVWKTENDNAFKLLDYQNKIYDTILKDKNKSVDERISEMQAHAAAFKDDYMMQLAKDRNIEAMDMHQEKMLEATIKGQKFANDIQLANEKRDLVKRGLEAFKQENPEATPQELINEELRLNGAVGGAGMKSSKAALGADISDEAAQLAAEQVLAGDKSALSNYGRGNQGSANLSKIRNKVAELAEEQGLSGSDLAQLDADFEGAKAEARTVGTRTGAIKVASEAVDGAADMALASSAKLDRTKYPDLNKVDLNLAMRNGDNDVVDFLVKNNTLINEYAAAQNPRGVPRVSDKDHAREILTTAYNKGQYETGVKAIKQEVANIKKAVRNVRSGKDSDEPSQEDLEFTAKKYGITIDDVKKRMKGE